MTNLGHIKLVERAPNSGSKWTLVAAGDFCAINRFVGKNHLEEMLNQNVTKDLRDLIGAADISIVNMEGPIRTSANPVPKSGPSQQMDAATPLILKKIGFDVISLANNHIMDYGVQGLDCTLKACEKEGLQICGVGKDAYNAMNPAKKVIAGKIRVSILAFCEREFGIADNGKNGSAWISHPLALTRVGEAAKDTDVVIVIAHGGVEEMPFSPIQRHRQLRQFIDAGATLVIGHHPHVPQGWERYKKGIIFYSLGNFLFDYFNNTRYPKTEWSFVIKAHFNGAALDEIELLPIGWLPDTRIGTPAKNSDRERFLCYLHNLSSLLVKPDLLIPYWQEFAVHLWNKRYLRYLQYACGVNKSSSLHSIRYHISSLYREINRRITKHYRQKEFIPPVDIKDDLLLLNTIRNESHRWTVETALAVLCGDEIDRRTPRIKSEVSKLLSWTEDSKRLECD